MDTDTSVVVAASFGALLVEFLTRYFWKPKMAFNPRLGDMIEWRDVHKNLRSGSFAGWYTSNQSSFKVTLATGAEHVVEMYCNPVVVGTSVQEDTEPPSRSAYR